ncbi:hypothetical protein AX14_011639 [Amanita brunnescens Koide BX004]|nr:hypothetical protein AX14_011639 [Amanita brunnescens Koide BX004]
MNGHQTGEGNGACYQLLSFPWIVYGHSNPVSSENKPYRANVVKTGQELLYAGMRISDVETLCGRTAEEVLRGRRIPPLNIQTRPGSVVVALNQQSRQNEIPATVPPKGTAPVTLHRKQRRRLRPRHS